MTKELRTMLAKLDTMKSEVRTLIAEDKTQEAKDKMSEVRTLQEKVDLQRELEDTEARGLGSGKELNDDGNVDERDMQELESEYRGIFLRGIRRRSISGEQRSVVSEYERREVMNEGGTNPAIPDGDSGLVVPKDVQTSINELMRASYDLSQYVNMQNVSMLSGSRVLEKEEDMTAFTAVDEYGTIGNTDNPKFTPVAYAVKKYAGILPMTNELLADNDANLLEYVKAWIAKKARFTRNSHIIALVKTWTATAFANVAAINKALNVTLDPAISVTAMIWTNQDGFDWLDNQVDGMGRPILQEDITQPGRKMFKGRPIVVLSNKLLPSKTGTPDKAPFVVGNFKEAVVFFNRRFFELASTNIGGSAFTRDTTDLRTIIRHDTKKWDDKAIVFGELSLS